MAVQAPGRHPVVLDEQTSDRPVAERTIEWNTRVRGVGLPGRWRPLGPQPEDFHVHLTALVCPGVALVVGRTGPARVHTEAAEPAAGRLVLAVHQGGDHVLLTHGDARTVPPGHLTVVAGTEASTWARPGRSDVAELVLDPGLLSTPPAQLQRALHVPLPLPVGMAELLLLRLDARHRAWDSRGAARYLVGLAELLLATVLEPAAAGEDTTAVRRRQVQAHIDAHLADPELGPDAIAAALFLSRRRLYQLLDGEEGVAERIRRLRVQRACELLADPATAHVPVAEVGTRCGFASPAAFAKVFRTALGVSPSGYRAGERV